MRTIVLAFLVLLTSAVTAQKVVKDANAEVRPVTSFHGISISNAFEVILTQGDEEAVAVSTSNPKFKDKIKVEVKDGILRIYLENNISLKWKNRDLKAYISFKNLDRITLSGATSVKMEGTVKADDVKINLSGASNLKGNFSANTLSINLSGASDMSATGDAKDIKIDASGASRFKSSDFKSDFCEARASGASDIRLTVNRELKAYASGASDVRYKGEGVIRDIRTSGSGSVSRL